MAVFVHAQDIKPPPPHPYLLTMFDDFYHAFDVISLRARLLIPILYRYSKIVR